MNKATWGVIIAAGKSEEFAENVSTGFLNLMSRPVLTYSMTAFEHTPEISGIVIVAPKDRTEGVRGMAQMFGCTKLKKIIVPSATRTATVLEALAAIDDKDASVVIHEASRPCVTSAQISEICKGLHKCDAAILGVRLEGPVAASGKTGIVADVVDGELFQLYTPAAYSVEALKKALIACGKKKSAAQSELEAIRSAKKVVRIVSTTKLVPRISTPADLGLIELLIRNNYPQQ